MQIAKRIFFFVLVNILIITTISMITSFFGIQPYLQKGGINYTQLLMFCTIWGFGGAFISLGLSKYMAKWMMGVKIIDPNTAHGEMRFLVERVHTMAQKAGLRKLPEVGIYESPEVNAFATGPSKNNSLVAVSTGLLSQMNSNEVDGVLAHEVSHIANGDMVTMTLIQGVVNSFVMFLARVAGHLISQMVDEEKRPMVQFGVVLLLEIALGILGMIVVSSFSRRREYRADAGAVQLSGRSNMISALERLKQLYPSQQENSRDDQPAIASLKISGKSKGFLKLFATHPDLEDRIQTLKQLKA